ncbi:MAG: hypothetical protein U1A78_30610 [Polyangia bacterium]
MPLRPSPAPPRGPFGSPRPRLFPSLSPQWAAWPLAWATASVLLLLLKVNTLRDPYWWDAIGCYFAEAWQLAFNLKAYLASHPEYVRAPLLCAVLALTMKYVSTAPWLLHGIAVVVTALALPAAYALVRQLGGPSRLGLLAAALVLVTPLYFAQAGLIQMDVPAASLVAVAWLCALRGRVLGYVLLGSLAVLTKESGYFLCLPTTVLWWARLVRVEHRRPLAPGTLIRVFPAGLPGVTLALWLVVHQKITGHVMSSDHTVLLGSLGSTAGGFLHNFIEGGRWLMTIPALYFLRRIWRLRDDEAAAPSLSHYDRLGVLATGLVWLVLPLCFPASLPRYMALSLPALAALAALGLGQLAQPRQAGVATFVVLALLFQWRGDSWHENKQHHLDVNLSYREMNAIDKKVAEALSAAGARAVLTEFPFVDVLGSPPEAGYLDRAIAAHRVSPRPDRAEVCAHDYFIEMDSTPPETVAAVRAHAELEPFKSFTPPTAGRGLLTPPWARRDLTVRVYRIRCAPTG